MFQNFKFANTTSPYNLAIASFYQTPRPTQTRIKIKRKASKTSLRIAKTLFYLSFIHGSISFIERNRNITNPKDSNGNKLLSATIEKLTKVSKAWGGDIDIATWDILDSTGKAVEYTVRHQRDHIANVSCCLCVIDALLNKKNNSGQIAFAETKRVGLKQIECALLNIHSWIDRSFNRNETYASADTTFRRFEIIVDSSFDV